MLAVSSSFQYAGDTAGNLWFLPKSTNERKTFLKDHLLELAPVLNGLAKNLDMTGLDMHAFALAVLNIAEDPSRMLISGLACRTVRIGAGFVHKRERTPGDGV